MILAIESTHSTAQPLNVHIQWFSTFNTTYTSVEIVQVRELGVGEGTSLPNKTKGLRGDLCQIFY